nr:hypothetical protein [Tanacetum cinerariifolium]
MQSEEGKIDSSKALDADLVVTKISRTESKKHDKSSKSRNDTHAEDIDIKPVNGEELMVEEIEILEIINIELEQSVAKLLAENEKLHKKNKHLKQTYKDLYDSIKKTRVQTKDLNDSLIAQVNSKTVENADLKAQIQEKVECEPPNGSNEDITNPYECDQTLNVSAGTLNFTAETAMSSVDNTLGPVPQRKERCTIQDDWDRLFQLMFDEYFNPSTIDVSPVQEAAAPRAEVSANSHMSISISQDAPSTNIPSSQAQEHSPIISQGFKESPKIPTFHDDPLNESPQDLPSQGSS